MSTLTSSLPLAVNPSSNSCDADAKRIASSLASSNSLTMASSFTSTDTATRTTTTFEEGDGNELKNEAEMNEIPSVNANVSVFNSDFRKDDVINIKICHEAQVHAGRVEHVKHEIRNPPKELATHTSTSNDQPQIIDFNHSGLYTPTSSSISGSGLASAPMPSPKSDADVGSENSHMPSVAAHTSITTTMATKQQHRKSFSVGTNANISNSKAQTRTNIQRQSRSGSVQLKATLELDTKGLESLYPNSSQHPPDLSRQQELMVNTPPEMLPPSPPLTNNELDMDDEGSQRNADENADADVDEAQSQLQTTETSDAHDEDEDEDEEEDGDGDVDGVNPQVEADIADGWQAPDSKLETTPGTPVLHSPSTTSLPSRIQESRFSLPISSPLAMQSSDDVPRSNPLSRTTSPASPLTKYNDSRSKSPKVKLSPLEFDLEKGEGDPVDQYIPASSGVGNDAKRRVSIEKGELEIEEAGSSLGVTKTFEVIRPNKRYSSPKPPKSSYYIGPPSGPTPFGTSPTGQIGRHHPRDIVRIERDYDHGELVQFSSAYPLELEGRITPTQFLETINAINERLISAHSLTGAFIFNLLAILTFWLSPFFIKSKYQREMHNLQILVDALNAELYNPQGLNILWPRRNAFLFLEIEYYVCPFLFRLLHGANAHLFSDIDHGKP